MSVEIKMSPIERELRGYFEKQEKAWEGVAGSFAHAMQTGSTSVPSLKIHPEVKISISALAVKKETEKEKDVWTSAPTLKDAINETKKLSIISTALEQAKPIAKLVPVLYGSSDLEGTLYESNTAFIVVVAAHHCELYQSRFFYSYREKNAPKNETINYEIVATRHIDKQTISRNYIPIMISERELHDVVLYSAFGAACLFRGGGFDFSK